MNKKFILYASIIIVFTICGTLYIDKKFEEEILPDEAQMLESNIELEGILFKQCPKLLNYKKQKRKKKLSLVLHCIYLRSCKQS